MPDKRDAIVLVPGARIAQQGEHLGVLLEGFRKAAESVICGAESEALIEGLKGRRLPFTFVATGETRQVDFFECYLSDLVPSLSQQSPLVKLREGTKVLLFWFTSGMWRGVRQHTYLVLSAIVSAIVFLLWYFSVLALGLTALGEFKPPEGSPLFAHAVSLAADWGKRLGSWVMWLGLATVLGMARADRLADISHFLRRYLTSDELREEFQYRLREPLYQIVRSGEYARVTLLAHSFGSLVAADVLAGFKHTGGPKVGVITLGSPAAVLLHMTTWLPDELKRCSENDDIEFWIDFSSCSDWMGAPVRFEGALAFPFAPIELRGMGGLAAQFTGGAHRAYFHRREVMECLVAPGAHLPKPKALQPQAA